MKSQRFAFLVFLFILSPLSAFAEDVTIKSIVNTFMSAIVQTSMGLLIAVASAAFFYGVFRYIWGIREGDETKVKTGNQFIIWGLISLFVMTSAWGIVKYTQNIFGIDSNQSIIIPNFSSTPKGGTSILGGSPTSVNGGNEVSSSSGTLDPTKTKFDGGSKDCPTGSSFDTFGNCVPIKSGDSELSAIGSSVGSMGASNEDSSAFLGSNEKKMVYAVNNGSLGALLQNNTGSNDEKMSKTIWGMFVKSNPPSVLQKVSSFQVFPTSPAGKSSLYGYVQGVPSGNGSWTLGIVVDTHMNGGVLDTAELYNTLLHEGHHITTLGQTDSAPATNRCSTDYGYGGKCLLSSSYLMTFIGKFYSGTSGAFASKYSDSVSTRAFVTDYAKTKPSEDIAETYMKFITDDRPSGNSIVEQKISFFYSYPELASTRSSVRSAIMNEASARGKDADGDGLVDTVEAHRGTDPSNADSDNDGIKDGEDADADGDTHTDTEEVDSDGDGVEDWADSDDDGDGVSDATDVDSDGDGQTDWQPAESESSVFQGDTNNDGSVDLGIDSSSQNADPNADPSADTGASVPGLPVED